MLTSQFPDAHSRLTSQRFLRSFSKWFQLRELIQIREFTNRFKFCLESAPVPLRIDVRWDVGLPISILAIFLFSVVLEP